MHRTDIAMPVDVAQVEARGKRSHLGKNTGTGQREYTQGQSDRETKQGQHPLIIGRKSAR